LAWLVAIGIFAVGWLFVAGHRRAAVALALVTVAAGASLYFYYVHEQDVVTSRIPISEVTLENVALTPTFRSSFDFTAKLTNRSPKYRLDGLEIAVTLRDCAGKDKASCKVIGRASATTAVTVPPGASTDLVAALTFGGDRPKAAGRFEWDYEVVATIARRQ
jgi:hypothetical protein